MPLQSIIREMIRRDGPMTLAAFMDLALYHPEHGYYARAPQRSGRAGDFFTSVDVGPLFGELLAAQFAEMFELLRARDGVAACDLVEAGAGNGRLTRDVLDAAAERHPDFYDAVTVTLVERSPAARREHHATLGPHAHKLTASTSEFSSTVRGIIFANELLDAMPAHAVVMRRGTLRELYVDELNGRLVETEGALSTPRLRQHFERLEITLAEGARAEVSLAATDWVRAAAATLDAGFLLLVDYGHEAQRLYSTHTDGTLMAYKRHTAGAVDWLAEAGDVDLTTHVDFTAVRVAAEEAGLRLAGLVDQTYFLTGLGLAGRLESGHDRAALARRLAARTLIMPGGLGSTMKAAVFARGHDVPALGGFSSGRLT